MEIVNIYIYDVMCWCSCRQNCCLPKECKLKVMEPYMKVGDGVCSFMCILMVLVVYVLMDSR